MARQAMALGVTSPQINPVASTIQGVSARQEQEMNNLTLAREAMKNIGSLAFGVMGGKLDGAPDPQRWEEALDLLGSQGMNVDAFRGRADLAPVVARASVDTLGQLNNNLGERELDQRIKEFGQRVMEAAKPKYGFMQGQDGTILRTEENAGSIEPIGNFGKPAGDGARPLTAEERAQWGIPQTDTRPYSIVPGKPPELVGGAGQTITVNNNGGDSTLEKALSEGEGKSWAGYKETGVISSSNAQDFQILDELMQVAPQGALTGRLAEAFPGFNSAGDAFQSIVKRIAPTLRAPGSGSTSDVEYAGMLQSLPALKNDPTANAMILAIMKAKAEINMQRAQIVTQFQNKEIDIADARKAMDELNRASVLTPEMRRALVGVGASDEAAAAAPSVGEIVDGYRFNGGNPADAASWTKVE